MMARSGNSPESEAAVDDDKNLMILQPSTSND